MKLVDFTNKISQMIGNHPDSVVVKNTIERMCEKIQEDENGCWVWKGGNSGTKKQTRGAGYGRISYMGQTAAVHRVIWSLCFGYLPSKKQIDHQCNNRLCCNPMHLKLVTHKQNQKLRDERD